MGHRPRAGNRTQVMERLGLKISAFRFDHNSNKPFAQPGQSPASRPAPASRDVRLDFVNPHWRAIGARPSPRQMRRPAGMTAVHGMEKRAASGPLSPPWCAASDSSSPMAIEKLN